MDKGDAITSMVGVAVLIAGKVVADKAMDKKVKGIETNRNGRERTYKQLVADLRRDATRKKRKAILEKLKDCITFAVMIVVGILLAPFFLLFVIIYIIFAALFIRPDLGVYREMSDYGCSSLDELFARKIEEGKTRSDEDDIPDCYDKF